MSLNSCLSRLSFAVLATVAFNAEASIITTANPNVSTEIGARIRWGATGFEASIFDNNPFGQAPTMNPSGTPAWQLNQPYKFEVQFDTTSGNLTLRVDFDRSGLFGSSEVISRSLFNGTTSYQGLGFNYLSISGNEGGSTARSNVSDLVINGTSLPSLQPGGNLLEEFYKDSSGGAMGQILISGNLTFTTSGTSQERPSWNFNFKGPDNLVPEPGSMCVWGALLLIGGIARRRRTSHTI